MVNKQQNIWVLELLEFWKHQKKKRERQAWNKVIKKCTLVKRKNNIFIELITDKTFWYIWCICVDERQSLLTNESNFSNFYWSLASNFKCWAYLWSWFWISYWFTSFISFMMFLEVVLIFVSVIMKRERLQRSCKNPFLRNNCQNMKETVCISIIRRSTEYISFLNLHRLMIKVKQFLAVTYFDQNSIVSTIYCSKLCKLIATILITFLDFLMF